MLVAIRRRFGRNQEWGGQGGSARVHVRCAGRHVFGVAGDSLVIVGNGVGEISPALAGDGALDVGVASIWGRVRGRGVIGTAPS